MYATSLNRSSSGNWNGGSIDAKIGTRFSVTMDLTRLFLNLLEQRLDTAIMDRLSSS